MDKCGFFHTPQLMTATFFEQFTVPYVYLTLVEAHFQNRIESHPDPSVPVPGSHPDPLVAIQIPIRREQSVSYYGKSVLHPDYSFGSTTLGWGGVGGIA
jgi:hypothetical protein